MGQPLFAITCFEHGKRGNFRTDSKTLPGWHDMKQVAAHQATCGKGHEVKPYAPQDYPFKDLEAVEA